MDPAPLDDVTMWARGEGLEIVLVVLGAILVTRAVSVVGSFVTTRIDRSTADTDSQVRSEQDKHRHSVAQVLVGLASVLVWSLATAKVITLLGFSLTGLVAPAAVLGVALGFGAQRIVQDLLAGFFIITERQYGFGDLVRISALGSATGVTGTVESISLRTTSMRSVEGSVIIIPNGQIVQVTNLSRDWARSVVDVPLSTSTDITAAVNVLKEVGAATWADPEMRELLLDEPSVMGVESITIGRVNVQMVARTLPGRQFEVNRALREQIIMAFHSAGISLPTLDAVAAGLVDQR
ncbi:MAG: mechanosensitive ion channel family protein [Sporichthyaceae bacterium]